MLSYWIDKVILHEPSDDDKHYKEVEWLLDWLIDGLRTVDVCHDKDLEGLNTLIDVQDMKIYRRCNIFERLLAMSTSSLLPYACMESIINLLFRCTYVEGCTTLVTRCGFISWVITALDYTQAECRHKLVSLAQRVMDTSDQARVDEWSGGGLESLPSFTIYDNPV